MIWNGHEMVEDRSIELPDITRELPSTGQAGRGRGRDYGGADAGLYRQCV